MCLLKLGIIRYNFFPQKINQKSRPCSDVIVYNSIVHRKVLALLGQEQDKTVEYRLKLWNNGRKTTSETRFSFLSLSFVEVSRFFHTALLSLSAFSLVSSRNEKLVPLLSLLLFIFSLRSFSGFVFQSQPKSSSFNFYTLQH